MRNPTQQERAELVAKGCSLCHRAATMLVKWTDTGAEWPCCDVHGDPERVKDFEPGLIVILNLDGSPRG